MSRRTAYFLVLCLLSIVVFWLPLTNLVGLSLQYEHYSHILLIPLVSVWLIYVARKSIFLHVQYSLGVGTVLLLVGLTMYSFAQSNFLLWSESDSLSASIVSIVVVWMAGFVLCYGTRAFRAATFPLSFLLLVVPIPTPLLDKIILMLQKGSAEVAFELFRLATVPVFREGFIFALPGLNIEVAKECSGIRSSTALFVVSLLAGHLFLRSAWGKTALALSILPVLIFKNGVRIVAISSLAVYVDRGFLTGWLHKSGGILFFLLGLAILAALLRLVQESEKKIYGLRGT